MRNTNIYKICKDFFSLLCAVIRPSSCYPICKDMVDSHVKYISARIIVTDRPDPPFYDQVMGSGAKF